MVVCAGYARNAAIYIPEHAIIAVKSGPTKTDSRMAQVLWDGRLVTMFVEDILQRGEEVSERSA